jgi:hypothetical protein
MADRVPRHLLVPWLLMSAATVSAVMVLIATIWLWQSFGMAGKAVAVGTVVFSFGALASLTIAFWTSVFLPALRYRRDNA